MSEQMMMEGLFLGIFGLIYIVVAIGMLVLTVVFLFKAISFMTKKTKNDERQTEILEQLLDGNKSHEID